MIVKTHKHTDGRILVTVVDTKLIGHLFEEGNLQLDLRDEFYRGEEHTTEETGDIIRNADMVELVGEDSVKLGVQEEVIDERNVKTTAGIPYASGVLVND